MTETQTETERTPIQRARFVAQWFLGDPSWADAMVEAFHDEGSYWYKRAVQEEEEA